MLLKHNCKAIGIIKNEFWYLLFLNRYVKDYSNNLKGFFWFTDGVVLFYHGNLSKEAELIYIIVRMIVLYVIK